MPVVWSFYIALYLFLGGLGAGAYLTSAVADIWGKGRYQGLSRFGAHISWTSVIVGLVMLILDLGRPELGRLDHILNVFNNPLSMVTIGTYLLSGFVIVALLTSLCWLSRWGKSRLRIILEIAGSVLAVGVAMYTGLLLTFARGIPLWRSPFLPWLFTISAASTGLALVGLSASPLGSILFPRFLASSPDETLHTISKADTILIGAELVAISLYLGELSFAEARRAWTITSLLGGVMGFVFWGVVVVLGLLVPLFIETYGLTYLKRIGRMNAIPTILMLAFVLIIIGGLALRGSIILAGQL